MADRIPRAAVRTVTATRNDDLLEGEGTLLSRLIHPMTPSEFMFVYQRQALAVVPPDTVDPGFEQRCARVRDELVFGLDLRDMLENTLSESIHVWLRNASSTGPGSVASFEVQDVETAGKLYSSGASLYFRGSQQCTDVLVRTLAKDLGLSFGGFYSNGDLRGELETFVSRSGHVTDWHTDYMENFTLQLEGTKVWQLKQSELKSPLRGVTPHFADMSESVREMQAKVLFATHGQDETNGMRLFNPPEYFEDAETVVLKPGSVLYFPAGMWHKVTASEDSVSINISLMPLSWAELLGSAVQHAMLRDPLFRQHVVARSPQSVTEHVGTLLSRLRSHVAGLQPTAVVPPMLLHPAYPNLPPHTVDTAPASSVQPCACSFEPNPLAVLLKADDLDGDDEETKTDGGVQGCTRYVCHLNFGNESFESLARQELNIPDRLCPLVDTLAQRVLRSRGTRSSSEHSEPPTKRRKRSQPTDSSINAASLLQLTGDSRSSTASASSLRDASALLGHLATVGVLLRTSACAEHSLR